jgi:hypothetical protein
MAIRFTDTNYAHALSRIKVIASKSYMSFGEFKGESQQDDDDKSKRPACWIRWSMFNQQRDALKLDTRYRQIGMRLACFSRKQKNKLLRYEK